MTTSTFWGAPPEVVVEEDVVAWPALDGAVEDGTGEGEVEGEAEALEGALEALEPADG